MGRWLALVGLRGERIGKHVIRLGGIVQSSKEPRIAAELAKPMPQLHQRHHASAGERAPPALPGLDGLPVHAQLFSERLLRQAGGLADELEQKASDEALAWSCIKPEPPAGTCRTRGDQGG